MEDTLVIPPLYESLIYGVSAVRISARKVYLCGPLLEVIESRAHKKEAEVGSKTFAELCAFVRSK